MSQNAEGSFSRWRQMAPGGISDIKERMKSAGDGEMSGNIFKNPIVFLLLVFLKDKCLLQGKSRALYGRVHNVWTWKKMTTAQGMRWAGVILFLWDAYIKNTLWVPQVGWCPRYTDWVMAPAQGRQPQLWGEMEKRAGGQEAPVAGAVQDGRGLWA